MLEDGRAQAATVSDTAKNRETSDIEGEFMTLRNPAVTHFCRITTSVRCLSHLTQLANTPPVSALRSNDDEDLLSPLCAFRDRKF